LSYEKEYNKDLNITDYYNNAINDRTSLHFSYQPIDNFLITYLDSQIKISYSENKPCHLRKLLFDQIEILFNLFPILKTIKLNHMDKKSWWSALWSPTKTFVSQFIKNSFVVYYNFLFEEENQESYSKNIREVIEIPLIGLLPKFQVKDYWFDIISSDKSDESNNLI